MTGRYPHRYGLQIPFCGGTPQGLNLNETLLPELLNDAGYTSHAVGKWHLGFTEWKFTPTFRGFSSFYGYYGCAEKYFTHDVGGALDFTRDGSPRCGANCSLPAFDDVGNYSTHLFGAEAAAVVRTHNEVANGPLFLYLAFQDTHGPAEVEDFYRNQYNASVPCDVRRGFAGKLQTLDEALGNVTAAFGARGWLDDLLIVFTAELGSGAIREGDWKLHVGGCGAHCARPGDWSSPTPWLNVSCSEPNTYNGSSPYQLYNVVLDPQERHDRAAEPALLPVLRRLNASFQQEVAAAHYPESRGAALKPLAFPRGKAWRPRDTPTPPAPPTPPTPPLPQPGHGHWVAQRGVFTDQDCKNVHKGNLRNVTLPACQLACLAALRNASTALKCTAVNFRAAAPAGAAGCVLRGCAPGTVPSGSQSDTWTRWFLGFFTYFVGQMVELTALTYATQVLTTTITQVSLVTNAAIATCLFGEQFYFCPPAEPRRARRRTRPGKRWYRLMRTWDLFNCLAVLVGVLIAILVTPPDPKELSTAGPIHVPVFIHYFSAPGAVTYFILLAIVIATLISRLAVLAAKAHARGEQLGDGNSPEGGYLFGLLAAANGTVVTSFAKPAGTLIRGGSAKDWSNPASSVFFLIFAFSAIGNLVVLNKGLARFEALLVYPTYSVVGTANTALMGLVLYQAPESWLASYHLPVWIFGFLVSLTAVYRLVAYRSHDAQQISANSMRAADRLEQSMLGTLGGGGQPHGHNNARLHMRRRTGTFVHSDYVSMDAHDGRGGKGDERATELELSRERIRVLEEGHAGGDGGGDDGAGGDGMALTPAFTSARSQTAL
eukprot:g976.t1